METTNIISLYIIMGLFFLIALYACVDFIALCMGKEIKWKRNEQEKPYMDNSEYDYGHDVRYDSKED